jgi:hypothetical protein
MIRKSGNGGGVIGDKFGAEKLREWVCVGELVQVVSYGTAQHQTLVYVTYPSFIRDGSKVAWLLDLQDGIVEI